MMQIPISFMDNIGVSSQEPLTLAKVPFITEKKILINIHIVQHPLHLVILLAIFLTVYSIAMVMNFYADLRLAFFIAGCSIHSFSKIGTTIQLCFTDP